MDHLGEVAHVRGLKPSPWVSLPDSTNDHNVVGGFVPFTMRTVNAICSGAAYRRQFQKPGRSRCRVTLVNG